MSVFNYNLCKEAWWWSQHFIIRWRDNFHVLNVSQISLDLGSAKSIASIVASDKFFRGIPRRVIQESGHRFWWSSRVAPWAVTTLTWDICVVSAASRHMAHVAQAQAASQVCCSTLVVRHDSVSALYSTHMFCLITCRKVFLVEVMFT